MQDLRSFDDGVRQPGIGNAVLFPIPHLGVIACFCTIFTATSAGSKQWNT